MRNITIQVIGLFLLLWSLLDYFVPKTEQLRWVFPFYIGTVGLYMLLTPEEEAKK